MADKTLKSLNFGGADNYFPLPIVSTNDNDNILVVADGEWVAKSPNDITGQYVWSKKDSADGPVTGYVISNDGEKYPDGGWSDGVFYTLELEPTLPATIISFKIDNWSLGDNLATYQAEEGMTWEEFVVSDYNTNSNFTIDSSNKIISSICGSGRPNSSSNYILKTDIIEPKTYLVDVAGVVFPLTIA